MGLLVIPIHLLKALVIFDHIKLSSKEYNKKHIITSYEESSNWEPTDMVVGHFSSLRSLCFLPVDLDLRSTWGQVNLKDSESGPKSSLAQGVTSLSMFIGLPHKNTRTTEIIQYFVMLYGTHANTNLISTMVSTMSFLHGGWYSPVPWVVFVDDFGHHTPPSVFMDFILILSPHQDPPAYHPIVGATISSKFLW